MDTPLHENIRRRRLEIGMTQDELAKELGYSGRSSITKIEKGLNDLPQSKILDFAKALCTTPAYLMGWEPKKQNHINAQPVHFIPIHGTVAAGRPLTAIEHIEGYIPTTLNGGATYFGLRVKGDSMTAAQIPDGCVVVVRKQSTIESSEIAVVLIGDEEATIKYFKRERNMVILTPRSYNPEHEPQIYDARTTEIQILGKVVQIVIDP